MLSSSYFPRAYFGALMLRRVQAVVVPPGLVIPADLADALRQVRAGLDRIEQLLLKKA